MNRTIVPLIGLVSLTFSPAMAADKLATAAERFYGKIVSIDQSAKNLTVHNNRQQLDTTFKWDEQTGVSFNKKPISASELKVGQFLMVSYVMENDVNKAKRISVRTPFQKSQP